MAEAPRRKNLRDTLDLLFRQLKDCRGCPFRKQCENEKIYSGTSLCQKLAIMREKVGK